VFDREVSLPSGTTDQFRRDGHVVVRGLASADEVASVRPAIEAAAARRTEGVAPLAERDTYGQAFLQALNLWPAQPRRPDGSRAGTTTVRPCRPIR
jgi:hypothetical protein